MLAQRLLKETNTAHMLKTTAPFATKTIESTNWNDSPRCDNDSLDCRLLNFSTLCLCMLFNHCNHFNHFNHYLCSWRPSSCTPGGSKVTVFGRQLFLDILQRPHNVLICNVVLAHVTCVTCPCFILWNNVKGQGLLPRCGGWQLLKLCLCQRPDHISLCINRSLIQGNYTTQRYLAVKTW